MTGAMHILERKLRTDWCERCRSFLEWVGPQTLSLITLQQANTSVVEKKEESSMVRLFWLGVVNFHHIQMSIVFSMQFIFNWQWLKWRTMFITFLLSGNDVISLKSRPLIFVFLYSINSEANCWTWYKKYISWRILDNR